MADYTISMEGIPGETFRMSALNSSALGIDSSLLANADGNSIIGLLVQAEGNAIRISFGGVTPVNVAPKVGHKLEDGQVWLIGSPQGCKSFKVINDVSGSVGIVQGTPFYEV